MYKSCTICIHYLAYHAAKIRKNSDNLYFFTLFIINRDLFTILRQRKRVNSFVLLSTFRNSVRILSFSLYKGSLGDWGKTGLRIGDRTQFHILPPKGRSVALQSAMNCIQWTPDAEPAAVLWLIIGCKGKQIFRKSKIYSHLFLSSLLNAFKLIAASFVAPARKVRIRLRPSIEIICWFFLCIELFYYLCTHNS